MASTHVVPRAYIWGFADTIRAGLEGRVDSITAFGRPYLGTGPRYFFPAMIALKLPIGLSVLVLFGLFMLFKRLLLPGSKLGFAIVLAAALLFLLVLALGSTYAGIRHALPIVVLLAIPGGYAIQTAFTRPSKFWKAVVGAALAVAIASAVPVMRPWEYFNEIIGGTKNGYLYFSDEGVDLWQRGKELAAYYHQILDQLVKFPSLTTHSLDLRTKRGIWTGLAVTISATKLGLAHPSFREQYWQMPSSWAKSLFGTRQICATPLPQRASEICWYFEERSTAAASSPRTSIMMRGRRSMPRSLIWKRENDCYGNRSAWIPKSSSQTSN